MAGTVCKTFLPRGSKIVDGTSKAKGSQSVEHNTVEQQGNASVNICGRRSHNETYTTNKQKKVFPDPLRHFTHSSVHCVAIRPFDNKKKEFLDAHVAKVHEAVQVFGEPWT